MHIIDVHDMKWRLKFNSHPNTPHKLKSLSKLTKRLQFPLRKGLCKHIFSILLWGDIHKIYNSFLYFRTHKVASSDLEGGNQYFGCPPPQKKMTPLVLNFNFVSSSASSSPSLVADSSPSSSGSYLESSLTSLSVHFSVFVSQNFTHLFFIKSPLSGTYTRQTGLSPS